MTALTALLAVHGVASAGEVALAWDASPGPVTGYVIYYGVSPNTYGSSVNVGNTTSHVVTGLAEGVRYYFVVKAYNAHGFSGASNEVDGVPPSTGLPFTDEPLVSGSHPIKAVHIVELRARIDALRVRYQLPPAMWTDLLVVPRVVVVKAAHIQEMRAALNAVYSAADRQLPSYMDAALGAGMPIRAVHIAQLRAAVVALETP